MTKYSRRPRIPPNYSLAHAILDILYDIGEAWPGGTPYSQFKRFRRETMWPQYKNWRLKRALRYLEERKRIKILKRGDELFFKLTKKGKLDALMIRMLKEVKSKIKWDGKWRIIIWDIPESSRQHRDRLRNFCKTQGFYLLQKSVFITPYPLPGSAVRYLKESGLEKFIRFLRIDQIDDDRPLRKHYGLKEQKKLRS